MAVTLVNTDNIADDATLRLGGAGGSVNAVTTAIVGGTAFVFATGFNDDGVNVFSLNPGFNPGELLNTDVEADGGTLELDGATALATAVIGGTTFLFVGGQNDNGISSFSVSAAGVLTPVDDFTDTEGGGESLLQGVSSLASVVVNGVTKLYAAAAGENGINTFTVDASGNITFVAALAGPVEVRGIASAVVGGTPYVFFVDDLNNSVHSFNLSNVDGSLTSQAAAVVDGAAPELELEGATAVTTAVVGSKTFLFVASIVDDGVSVFEVATNGSLTNVDNVTDTEGAGELFLDGAAALATAVIAGNTFLFIAGLADNGVSVFGVAPDGTLVHVADVGDDGAGPFELNTPTALSTVVSGSDVFLISNASVDSGLSVFRVDVTGFTLNGTSGNDIFDPTNSAPGQLLPSQLDDTIFGFAGADTIEARGGNDRLIGGTGKDSLTGDAGADRFDFNKAKESVRGAQRDVITDFNAVDDDVIDLGGIDAKSGVAGNQHFKFINAHKFHHVKGELHFVAKIGFVVVEGDTNGDGRADFQIQVDNVTSLVKGDFLL